MALIQCPNCSKNISDKATSCPHCGSTVVITTNSEYNVLNFTTFQTTILFSIKISAIVLLLLNISFQGYFEFYGCFWGAILDDNSFIAMMVNSWNNCFHYVDLVFGLALWLMFVLVIKSKIYKILGFVLYGIFVLFCFKIHGLFPFFNISNELNITLCIIRIIFWLVLAIYYHKRLTGLPFIFCLIGSCLIIGNEVWFIHDIISLIGSVLLDLCFISILFITKRSWFKYFNS